MSTSISSAGFECTNSIYVDNNIFRFDPDLAARPPLGIPIAAAKWVLRDMDSFRAYRSAIGCAVAVLDSLNANLYRYVTFADSKTQPDNRIIRHKRIKGRLKSNGIDFGGADVKDTIKKFDGGIRFYGVVNASIISLDLISNILMEGMGTYVIFCRDSIDDERFLQSTWTGEIYEDIDFIENLISRGFFVLKEYRAHSRREAGICMFATEIQIAAIAAQVRKR